MLKNWMGIFFYIGRASGQVCVIKYSNLFMYSTHNSVSKSSNHIT